MRRILLLIIVLFACLLASEAHAVNYGDDVAGTTSSTYGGGYIYFHKISVTTGGTVNKISFYIQGDESTGNVKGNIYGDSSGNPGSPISNGATDEHAWNDSADTWIDLPHSGTKPTVSDSTTYWIAIWSTHTYSREKTTGGSSNWCYDQETYGNPWPDPANPSSLESRSGFDAYIEVTTSTGTSQIILIEGI